MGELHRTGRIAGTTRNFSRFADAAGVLGAVLAALCCAGAPVILGVLSALGLSFLRRDAILLPFMLLAFLVALWGLWRDRATHRSSGPIVVALVGMLALAAGVIFVHGFPAKELIGIGVIALLSATVWNASLRRACSGSVDFLRTEP